MKFISALLIVAGSFFSCSSNSNEFSDSTKIITGIVIGSYNNGFAALLVQVDEKYPIGKTIEYLDIPGNYCTRLPNNGAYSNMIQVQYGLPLSDFPENESIINKRISFSYRICKYEEDCLLFYCDHIGNAMCIPPDVPIYVVTDCQILKYIQQ